MSHSTHFLLTPASLYNQAICLEAADRDLCNTEPLLVPAREKAINRLLVS